MTSTVRRLALTAGAVAFASTVLAQHTAMPAGMTHEEHMAQMKKDAELKEHGNAAMGFDQDSTTHHFLITPKGGTIAVDANDPADQAGRSQIRAHLKEIAVAFRNGDFAKPLATHGELPPGVPVMQQLRHAISYKYEETTRGGLVRIETSNGAAVAAIHQFLTYQIAEHKTGDPVPADGAAAASPHAGQADHFERHFDNAEEWAKSFDDPARDAWQMPDRIIEALQLKAGEVVADIGAGTGYFTIRLAQSQAKPRVYAVDIEPSMVEHVKRRADHDGLTNVVAVLGGADRTNLPVPVDLALVVDTFHHIPNRVAYFTALRAQMTPGGRLAVIDFRKDAPSGPPVQFRFTPQEIAAELAKAGFTLQETHEFLPQQLFLVFRAG